MADAPDYSGWFRRDAFNKFTDIGWQNDGTWWTVVTHTVPVTYNALCIAQWFLECQDGSGGGGTINSIVEVDGVQAYPSDATTKDLVLPAGGWNSFLDPLYGYIVALAGQVVRIRAFDAGISNNYFTGELWGFYI